MRCIGLAADVDYGFLYPILLAVLRYETARSDEDIARISPTLQHTIAQANWYLPRSHFSDRSRRGRCGLLVPIRGGDERDRTVVESDRSSLYWEECSRSPTPWKSPRKKSSGKYEEHNQ